MTQMLSQDGVIANQDNRLCVSNVLNMEWCPEYKMERFMKTRQIGNNARTHVQEILLVRQGIFTETQKQPTSYLSADIQLTSYC